MYPQMNLCWVRSRRKPAREDQPSASVLQSGNGGVTRDRARDRASTGPLPLANLFHSIVCPRIGQPLWAQGVSVGPGGAALASQGPVPTARPRPQPSERLSVRWRGEICTLSGLSSLGNA